MSAEQPNRLSTFSQPKDGDISDLSDDLSDDLTDDFINQFIDDECPKSLKESTVEQWCEQILFNTTANQPTIERSVDECFENELHENFIDELVKITETNQNAVQSSDCFIGDDQVSTDLHTDHLINEHGLVNEEPHTENVSENGSENGSLNEFYVIRDHIYSKPPAMLLNSNSSKIDKPLNSFDDFNLYLSDCNAFQNSNFELYVN